jgi:ABC-type uncharacterized transport system permease subunit
LAVPALLALAAYTLAAVLGPVRRQAGAAALALGWLLHALVLALDIAGSGGTRLGFAPVLSLTVWLVVAVHEVESRLLPLPTVRRVLALAGMAAVALAWAVPATVRPVAGSAWAPLHFVLGVASYGLFGAAVLHGALLDATERRMRRGAVEAAAAVGGMPLLRLERLTFRFVQAGFVVLTLALLLGVATTEVWRFSHKIVFSVLAWGVFAALLAGRQWRGWRGRSATRWLYVGAVLLLLAYAGVHFVLQVLLARAHS